MDKEQLSLNDSIYNGDSYDIAIQALSTRTKNLISALLNPPKIFLSDGGLSRDWHGLAELVGIGGERVPHLQCGGDPTSKVLTLWQKENKDKATIKNLLTHLEQLDRFDIVDDIKSSVDEDIKIFEQNKNQVNTVCIDTSPENLALTHDDLKRFDEGLGPQQYDAFILFAIEDIGFATELIENLEKHQKFKVCVKDRDLVPGVFEHESVIKLIAERCNRLVAIFSPSFFQSSSNKFFLSFAQSLGIEQRRRKIIPCLNTHCKVPPEYSCYFMLNRGRTEFVNFWERLGDAIRAPQCSPLKNQNIYRSASQKISPVCINNETESPSQQLQTNSLRPKRDCGVKFNSMVNLNYVDNDGGLKPNNNCVGSLTSINLDNKKKKSKLSFLKKMLPRKAPKCNVIEEVPKHKDRFFTRTDKRKVALVN